MALGNYLARSWWKYLLAVSLPCLLLPYVFQQMDKPKEEETLQVFLCEEVQDLTLFQKAEKKANTEGIRSFNVYNFPSSLSQFDTFYSLQGLTYSDVILSPKSALDNHYKEGCYLPLDSLVEEGNPRYYVSKNNEKLGLLVYEKTASDTYDPWHYSTMLKLDKEEEPLYLSLNQKMPNIGSYNSLSKVSNTQAITLFKEMTSLVS
jgi:hypothetical protein